MDMYDFRLNFREGKNNPNRQDACDAISNAACDTAVEMTGLKRAAYAALVKPECMEASLIVHKLQ
jgi:hypothetical protein